MATRITTPFRWAPDFINAQDVSVGAVVDGECERIALADGLGERIPDEPAAEGAPGDADRTPPEGEKAIDGAPLNKAELRAPKNKGK